MVADALIGTMLGTVLGTVLALVDQWLTGKVDLWGGILWSWLPWLSVLALAIAALNWGMGGNGHLIAVLAGIIAAGGAAWTVGAAGPVLALVAKLGGT